MFPPLPLPALAAAVLALIAAIGFIPGLSSGSSAPAEAPSQSPNATPAAQEKITLNPNTVVISRDDVLNFEDPIDQPTVLLRPNAPIALSAADVGRPLMVTAADGAGGSWGRISEVSVTATGTLIHTVPTPLSDVYTDYQIHRSLTLSLGAQLPEVALECSDGAAPHAMVDTSGTETAVELRLDPITHTSALTVHTTGTIFARIDAPEAALCTARGGQLTPVTIPLAGPLALRLTPTLAVNATGPTVVEFSGNHDHTLGAVSVGATTQPALAQRLSALSTPDTPLPSTDGAEVVVGITAEILATMGAEDAADAPLLDWQGTSALSIFPQRFTDNPVCRTVRGQQDIALTTHRSDILGWDPSVYHRSPARPLAHSCPVIGPSGPTLPPRTAGGAPDLGGKHETLSAPGPLHAVRVHRDGSCSWDQDPAAVRWNACRTTVLIDATPTPLLPVSQASSGTGSAVDPLVTVTRLRDTAGKIALTQVDTVITGSAGWTTTISVHNADGVEHEIAVRREGYCTEHSDTCTPSAEFPQWDALTLGTSGGDAENLMWVRALSPGATTALRSRALLAATGE